MGYHILSKLFSTFGIFAAINLGYNCGIDNNFINTPTAFMLCMIVFIVFIIWAAELLFGVD